MNLDEPQYPESFYCPLTHELMIEPVVDPEGNSYERSAIVTWLLKNPSSPITRSQLRIQDLVPNRALQDAISYATTSQRQVLFESHAESQLLTVSDQNNDDINNKISALNISLYETEDDTTDVYALVSVKTEEIASRSPVDICCIVDISASMNQPANIQNQSGDVESQGFCILDIVKHAVKTIIHTLQPTDRFSLVSFSSVAKVIFSSLFMTPAGKQRAEMELLQLSPLGQTNLWDGLHSGLELLRESMIPGRPTAIMLLTDGQPNVVPPRGHIPMLKKYTDRYPSLGITISTFGFGYSLDSDLLKQIAEFSNGTYSFIPDSAFVGTAFINTHSNILASFGKQVTLEIEAKSSAQILHYNPQLKGSCSNSKLKFDLGPLQYGQSRDFVIRVKFPTFGFCDSVLLEANLNFIGWDNQEKNLHTEVTSLSVIQKLDADIEYHRFRSLFIEIVSEEFKKFQSKPHMVGNHPLICSFEETIGRSEFVKSDQRLNGLAEDLRGEVVRAFSRNDWFQKWGVHYLPSLIRAHLLQQCNNFKDPGVQFYGGKLFEELRDFAEDVFCKLPPPRPSLNPKTSSPASSSSMANSYYNRSVPCFAGNCLVTLSDGSEKLVKNLLAGDFVKVPNFGSAKILCVVETKCFNQQTELVKLGKGLLITPYHPVIWNGQWQFPCNISPALVRCCEAVYSFVLERGHVMEINGISCVSWGHNFTDEFVAHDFFGSDRVITELRKYDSWNTGKIQFNAGCLLRDGNSSVIGFVAEQTV